MNALHTLAADVPVLVDVARWAAPPMPGPVAIQAAKPDRFLSAETKAKLLALHIINATYLRGRLS